MIINANFERLYFCGNSSFQLERSYPKTIVILRPTLKLLAIDKQPITRIIPILSFEYLRHADVY